MREDWEEVELIKVCFKAQKVKRKEMSPYGTLKYLDIGGIDNASNTIVSHKDFTWENAPSRAQQIVKKGDVLFSTVRTYLKNIAQVKVNEYDNEICSSGFTVLRGNPAILNSSYLFYLSLSVRFLNPLSKLQTGTSYPAVRDKDVFAQNIPLAPLPEQRAIVAKIEELFSDLDKGIADLKKAQDQLKVYRQAVLKKAFEGELTKGVTIKTSELENLSSQIHYGYTASSSKDPVGPHLLRITDIQNNNVDWRNVPFCAIGEDKIKDYLLQKGDILFARTGATVGKSFLIANDIPKSVFASYLIRVQLKGDVLPQFIAYFFQSPKYWIQIGANSVGIGQPNVNGSKLKKLLIDFPASIEEQHQIVRQIESRLSVCDKVEESITESLEKAKALRQSILKKGFEGTLLSEEEIATCKAAPDYEPASVLLARIERSRKEKIKAEKKK